jgi:hypothetical protein
MAKSRYSVVIRKQRPLFLDALASGSTVADAAKATGIGLRTVYTWRAEDTEFADEWDEAYRQGASALETEARRRAIEGTLKPIFNRGVQAVDYMGLPAFVREYSDTLLLFLMKARDPLRYCDRARTAALMRKWGLEDGKNRDGETVPCGTILSMIRELQAEKAALTG